jgi:CRISPR system Cascade subunit CasA
MKEKEFNLLNEPWIAVIKHNGQKEEVSLVTVFERAHEWKRLAGEMDSQDIAVLRLLLAILHAVFSRYDLSGKFEPIKSPSEALWRWKSLWDKRTLDVPIINEYLNMYSNRFWLFHPEAPFYQVPNLENATEYTAAKLNGTLSESNNKLRLFPQRSGDEKTALSYPEAARWLLYINSFDDTSAKPKGKGLPSPGAGWLGKLGLIIAVGDNLFETLLLNMIFLKDGLNELWGKESPIWENPVRTGERVEISIPDNPSELLTIQSRRLLLKRLDEKIIGFSLLGGEFFQKENAFAEQMTVWKNTAKKESDSPVYQPKRHDPARQIWRDFSTIAVQRQGKQRPGVVSWIARLKAENIIPLSLFRFQTVSLKYADKDFFVEDLSSDMIAFSSDLLTYLGNEWLSRIVDEIEITDRLVQQVGILAQNVAKAKGDINVRNCRDFAKQQGYYRLDLPFRKWLSKIDPINDEMNDVCNEWWEEERRIIRRLGNELVEQAGVKAFIGRIVIENGKENRYAAPKAFNRFLYNTASQEVLKLKGDKY